MKRISGLYGAAVFTALTLSSCGGFTGAVVPKEGAKNIRMAEFNHDYNNGWNSYSYQSLVLPNRHIFISKKNSDNSNTYILERYDDTLGKVWSQDFQNPYGDLQPSYFLADGMIKSLSYAKKKNQHPSIVGRVIDPANGTIISTQELALPEAGQSPFITKMSADNSKILVANFEKKGSAYNLVCRVMDSKFNLLKNLTIPLEFAEDMIFLSDGDRIKRKAMVEGTASLETLVENYYSLFNFTVTSGGEVLVLYALRSNNGELIVKKGSTGEKIVAPIGITGSQPEYFFNSFALKEAADGKILFASSSNRAEDDFALVTAEFDVKNSKVNYIQSHNIDEAFMEKEGVKDYNATGARPIFIAPAADGGFVAVAEPFTGATYYSQFKQKQVGNPYYGAILLYRIDNSGKLLWTRHIERTQFLNKGGYESILFLEGSTHITQMGDKLKLSYRDRDSDDGFSSYEFDINSGNIKKYDIPFKFDGIYKGGVTYLRDLSQWVDENTLVLVGHEGQLGSTGKIIQINVNGE